MKRWSVPLTGSALLAALLLLSSGAPSLAREITLAKADKQDVAVGKETVAAYTGPKKRLGVMDLEVKITSTSNTEPTATGGLTQTTTISLPPPADFGAGLTEMLTTALMKTNRFVLLERKAMTDIAAEQQLGVGGGVNPESAPKAGNVLGAQALIRGAVTEFAYNKSSVGAGGILKNVLGVSRSSVEAMIALDIRIYDTTTSQITDSVRAEGRAKSSGTAVDFNRGDIKLGGSGYETTPLGQATRQAIERAVAFIVERMAKFPWEGRIAEMDGGDGAPITALYINAGSDLGLKAGDELDILRPGRAITDPETHVVIGRTKDKALGRCRIDTITEKLAVAVPLEGEGFQKGDAVRLQEAGKP